MGPKYLSALLACGIVGLARLDPVGLTHQAETLLQKRWHEVTKLLPSTIAELGSEAEELFRYLALKSWPEGHRRHALDAADFIGFLEHNQLVHVDSAEKRKIRRLAVAATARSPLESIAGLWCKVNALTPR